MVGIFMKRREVGQPPAERRVTDWRSDKMDSERPGYTTDHHHSQMHLYLRYADGLYVYRKRVHLAQWFSCCRSLARRRPTRTFRSIERARACGGCITVVCRAGEVSCGILQGLSAPVLRNHSSCSRVSHLWKAESTISSFPLGGR